METVQLQLIKPAHISDDDYQILIYNIQHKLLTIKKILKKTDSVFVRTLFINGFFTQEEIYQFIDKYPILIFQIFELCDKSICQQYLIEYQGRIINILYQSSVNHMAMAFKWFFEREMYHTEEMLQMFIIQKESKIVEYLLHIRKINFSSDPFMFMPDKGHYHMLSVLLRAGYYPSANFFASVDSDINTFIMNPEEWI